MAKGTCGESATRKNRSTSSSTTRSANRKRSRATNNGSNNANNATAKRAAAFTRGMNTFKRISRGNVVSKIEAAVAKKALALGEKHSKKVNAGKQLTPGEQKELELYMEALSESPNIQEELELELRKL